MDVLIELNRNSAVKYTFQFGLPHKPLLLQIENKQASRIKRVSPAQNEKLIIVLLIPIFLRQTRNWLFQHPARLLKVICSQSRGFLLPEMQSFALN